MKFREFWLFDSITQPMHGTWFVSKPPIITSQWIHVIEHAAYAQAQAEIAELKDQLGARLYQVDETNKISLVSCENCKEIAGLKAKLEIAVEALEKIKMARFDLLEDLILDGDFHNVVIDQVKTLAKIKEEK